MIDTWFNRNIDPLNEKNTENINTNVETDILQREKFLKFIGWVLKRVREESSKQQKLVLKVSINNVISIDKTEVLNTLKFLFVDSKKNDGSYEVVPHSDLLPFFVKLKNFTKSL